MKIVNYLKGGLGNQLFQHIFARTLGKHFGVETVTDVSHYGHDPYGHKQALAYFDPAPQIVEIAQLPKGKSYLLTENAVQAANGRIAIPNDAEYVILEGYWQNEAYLDQEEVRRAYATLTGKLDTSLDADIRGKIQATPNPVALHIRRHDYKHHGLCDEMYYITAARWILSSHPDARIFVFSDEPNYSSYFLSKAGLDFTLVSTGNDIGDFYLMSLCRHFVIANSTYSWWAAYFGESRGGVIVCPDPWILLNTMPSPCPPRWTRVEGVVKGFSLPD